LDAPAPPAVALLDGMPPPTPGEVARFEALADVADDDFISAPITEDAVTSDVA